MRWIMIITLGVLAFFLVKAILPKLLAAGKRCPKCEGQGWWPGNKVRERCDMCKGTGRIERA